MSKIVATVDLGSNSFHMLISEINSNGKAITLSKQKQKVQLRAGLNKNLTITKEVQEKAIRCLEFFAEEIKKYKVEHISAVGTYTLRKAKNKTRVFKKQLDKALGVNIEIVSGAEEARLVYVGARNDHNPKLKTMVIDIGGGSTELVIGKGGRILVAKSLDMGCVGAQKDCFANDNLDFKNFHNAVFNAKKILEPIVAKYKRLGWDSTLGSSGTMIAVADICLQMTGKSIITKDFLSDLIMAMIDRGTVGEISFKGLREDRENVLAGGVSILYAIFDSLGISEMSISKGAVREGMLYELVKSKYKISIN